MKLRKVIKGLFLKTLILVFAGFFISENEKSELSIAKYKIKSKKIENKYRFVFLSDLHNKEFGKGNEFLLSTIDRQNPDAVLIGGDMITADKSLDFDSTISLCKKLSKRYRVFYANGNHELKIKKRNLKKYEEFKNIIESMNISYLDSKKESFSSKVDILGLNIKDDCYKKFRYGSMSREEIELELGKPDKEKFNILLAHTPNLFEEYAKYGADLSLCGHFHGGTIRINGDIGLMTPQFQLFNDRVAGMKSSGMNKMIVSAGLGTHTINIRINNKPQVVVIDIEGGKE